MKKYTILVLFALIIVVVATSGSFARLAVSMDKTPDETRQASIKAEYAAIETEKHLKAILVEAKKTNELLEKLVQQSSANR